MGCVGWRETEPELPAAPMGTELPGLPQQRAVDAHTRAHLHCTPVSACVQAHGALAQPGTWAASRTPCSALQPRGGKGLLRWDPSAPQGAARAGEGRSRGSPRCHLHLQRVPSLCRVSQGHRALAGGDACWWQEEAGTLLAPLPVGDRAAGTWPPCVPHSRAPGEGLCPWLSLPQAPQPLPASPRCAGEREGAAPAAAEHPGQMRRAHFASPAEAAEPQACTYPAATWHGKKGHSSRRNSLHAWRHPLLTAREATGRVFPVPQPLRSPGWPQGAVLGCCLCHPIPSGRSQPLLAARAGAVLARIQQTQRFGAEPGCHQAQLRQEERIRASLDAGVPSFAAPLQPVRNGHRQH